ncbi:hypothetical protein JCM3775_005375 [Rhodotorula graminis]
MAPRPRLPALIPPARHLHSSACARHPPPPLPTTVAASLAAASSSTGPAPDTLSGWIRSVRRQKNVSFAVLSDGSQVGGVQVVLPKGLDDGFTVGCSASLRGAWVDSRGQGQAKEFKVDEVTFVGESDAETYPMPNTKQGIPLPVLRRNAHLRPRKDGPAAMLRVRSEMNWALSDHFRREGFVRVELPIITSSDCEGAGEVFRVVEGAPKSPAPASTAPPAPPASTADSPKPAPPPAPSRYLTVSTQLHLEAVTSSLQRAYTFAPCFRAEKSDTSRHLQEFWMLEAEAAFLDADVPTALDQVMHIAESTVRAIATHVRAQPDVEAHFAAQAPALEAQYAALLAPAPYPRLSYTRAVELLATHAAAHPGAFAFAPVWGAGLQTEHERWLAEDHVRGPLFVTDYPSALKPFYMLANEAASGASSVGEAAGARAGRQTTACFDLLVPGVGELAGGSLREHRREQLVAAMDAHGLDHEGAYRWYVDLRRYGTTRHGGFGLGWERLVGLLTGETNVRECTAFPRAAEGSRF